MSNVHKNLSQAELHNPKGFDAASNNTVLTKDSSGDLVYATVGGTTIYNASNTVGAGRVLTLTDTINFTGGKFGIGVTPTAKLHLLADGNGTGVFILAEDSGFVDRLKILDNGNIIIVTGGNASIDITGAVVFRQSSAGVSPFEVFNNVAAIRMRITSGGLFQFTTGGTNSFDVTAAAIFRQSSPGVLPFQINLSTAANHFTMGVNGDIGVGGITNPLEDVHALLTVRCDVSFNLNGVDGIGAIGGTTFTFGGGGAGDIATMTFRGGILTAVTTV